MRVGVQQLQTLLVTTKCALWRYDNVFLFANQSEVDFGIAHVLLSHSICRMWQAQNVVQKSTDMAVGCSIFSILYS
jgi:hypothetical protein